MATSQGTLVFDFGAVPGTNVVTATVADATIGAASKVELYLMGTDSTAGIFDRFTSPLESQQATHILGQCDQQFAAVPPAGM
jgi:hypothetical protein